VFVASLLTCFHFFYCNAESNYYAVVFITTKVNLVMLSLNDIILSIVMLSVIILMTMDQHALET